MTYMFLQNYVNALNQCFCELVELALLTQEKYGGALYFDAFLFFIYEEFIIFIICLGEDKVKTAVNWTTNSFFRLCYRRCTVAIYCNF